MIDLSAGSAGFEWYTLYHHGFITPLVILIGGLALMTLWELRIVSTRTFYALSYLMLVGYAIHVDYVMFIAGLKGIVGPLHSAVPWLLRVVGYAAVLALTTYVGAGMARRTDWKGKLDLPRGLPYLKERWRERKEKRG
ncbi:MAG: hypothetical protein Q8M66_02175 [Actinomycetota bacterium]|nr:hypothetical protein [Actinomycetota bacterium]MDZ4180445.1 hypothetical protein [Coriobacteriia bacterium]